MKAAVIYGLRHIVDDPKLKDSTDLLLKVTAICGSDLHIYNGIYLSQVIVNALVFVFDLQVLQFQLFISCYERPGNDFSNQRCTLFHHQ